MTATDQKARTSAFFEAIARFDPHALDTLLSADAEQIELPNRLKPEGARKNRAGMLSGLEQGRSILAEQSCTVTRMAETENVVFVEWHWEGALAIPLGSLEPGDRMRADCVAVIRFTDGLISQIRNYDCYAPYCGTL